MGRMMALATRYEVSAQDASSTLAERLPAMCGRDTFTTVVSSTSMKVANMTATIHGFTFGGASACAWVTEEDIPPLYCLFYPSSGWKSARLQRYKYERD